MKLIDFLDDWLENVHREYIKHQTYVRYRSNINNYVRNTKFAQMELNEITRKDVQDFVNGMKKIKGAHTRKPLAAGTINNTYIVVQSAFNYAEDYELIEKNPCVRIRRVIEPKRSDDIKCFTIEEQKQIENYIDKLGDMSYYCYIVDLYTGLRIGELCALTWSDIDFSAKTLSVNKEVYYSVDNTGKWRVMSDSPKTRTSVRTIPLPPHLVKGLTKLWRNSSGQYIFSKKDGNPTSPDMMRWRYDEMLKKIGLRHLNFHCLRHTFATRAIERGIDVKTLSEILGHSSPSITLDIYTHSMEEHKRDMMEKMKRI